MSEPCGRGTITNENTMKAAFFGFEDGITSWIGGHDTLAILWKLFVCIFMRTIKFTLCRLFGTPCLEVIDMDALSTMEITRNLCRCVSRGVFDFIEDF